jgi:chaperonin cofactor prefoldin
MRARLARASVQVEELTREVQKREEQLAELQQRLRDEVPASTHPTSRSCGLFVPSQ